jgi:hypothetical protein
MFYTAVWCLKDETAFKKSVPLGLLGESLKRFQSTIGFNIVVLEGIERLTPGYLSLLETLGFFVVDQQQRFRAIVARYPNISNFYSHYERNCLLRWIVFKEMIAETNNHGRQFWHLDSDVVLHTSLDLLAADTREKTFMLQGCPAFLSVSNYQWFEQYERELNKLENDIIGYSAAAAAQKSELKKKDLNLVNQSLYRNPIGSDQDLLEYLVASKKIIQDTSERVFQSDFYYMENPLTLNIWHALQGNDKTTGFSMTEDTQLSISNRKVPFIHYQSTFTEYAGLFVALKKFRIPQAVVKKLMWYKIIEADFISTRFFRYVARAKSRFSARVDRDQIIHDLMTGSSEKSLLPSLLNFLLKNQ